MAEATNLYIWWQQLGIEKKRWEERGADGRVETRVSEGSSIREATSILLGTDAPCLEELLQQTSQAVRTEDIMEAFVVTTRERAQACQERERDKKKKMQEPNPKRSQRRHNH